MRKEKELFDTLHCPSAEFIYICSCGFVPFRLDRSMRGISAKWSALLQGIYSLGLAQQVASQSEQCVSRDPETARDEYLTFRKASVPTKMPLRIKRMTDWVLRMVDRDGNGNLTKAEVLYFMESHPESPWAECDFASAADNIFSHHDRDANGVIAVVEVYDALVEWNLERLKVGKKWRYYFDKSTDPVRAIYKDYLGLYGMETFYNSQELQRLSTISDFASFWAKDTVNPIVIEDGAKGISFYEDGWTCERFAAEFEDEKIKRVHEKSEEGENLHRFGDTDWIEQQFPINGIDEKYDKILSATDPPKFAPYYWGVKEKLEQLVEKTPEMFPRPYFLSDRDEKLTSSPEFWFSAPEAGARVHTNSHCESTVSFQIAGSKRWRVGPMHPVWQWKGIQGVPRLDGDLPTDRWQPAFETVLNPGEALIMPPGSTHETFNVGEVCAASLTMQFSVPLPAAYLRAEMPRLLLGGQGGFAGKLDKHSMRPCFKSWSFLATLRKFGHVRVALKKELDAAGDASTKYLSGCKKNGVIGDWIISNIVDKLWGGMTDDGQESLSLADIVKNSDKDTGLQALAYLDTSGNNMVEKEELLFSWTRFVRLLEAVKGADCLEWLS